MKSPRIITTIASAKQPLKRVKRSSRKGFTLIEGVIVIVLLGVVALLAGPIINGIFGTAQTNRNDKNASEINTVLASAAGAGATVGAGAGNDFDTTSITTLLADLGAGVTENGITFRMETTGLTTDMFTLTGSVVTGN